MFEKIHRRGVLAGAGALTACGLTAPHAFAQGSAAAAMPSPPTPEQWAKEPTMTHIALSPNGTQIAYMHEESGNKVLYHFNTTTDQVSAFNTGTQIVTSLQWIGDEHVALVLHRAIENSASMGLRNKIYTVSIYNMTKKSVIALFDAQGHGADWTGELQRVMHAGKPHILSSFWDDDNDRQCLVRFGMDQETYTIIDTGGPEVGNWVVTADGDLVGRSEYYVEDKTWVLSYRQGNNWKKIYEHKGELNRPSLIGLGRDGKSLVVYLRDEEEGKQNKYFEVDSQGTLSAPLDAPGISVSAMFDRLTYRLTGFASYDGWFSYHYFNPADQALVTKAQNAVPGYRMSIAEQADDPNIMIVYSEGEDDAGTYYLINFKTGASLELGMLYPDIPFEWITSKNAITYKAADGLEIEAYLTLPPGREAKNLPLVMHPHGGPAARDDMSYDWEVQAFASRGYAVLQPNFRGSEGYGEAFERMGDGQVGRKMQTDLSDGVRYLAGQGIIDPKRVCIVGTSYGGYAAFAGATIDIGVYNCAVAIAGLSDATKWLEAERGYMSVVTSPAYTYTKRLLGDETKLDEISPIKHIAHITIPILIMHGKDDSVVASYQSTDMVNALKAAGKTYAFKVIDHAEHGATTEASRTEMIRLTLDFIEKYNPPA